MNNIYKINDENIKKAKKLIEQGELIAIPTETVYGLCADATNEQAVRKIFEIKKRSYTNPINILISNKNDIEKYTYINNDIEKGLIQYFIPGPITIILDKKENMSDIITSGNSNLGIRIPNLIQTINILKGVGKALATPSANISGKPVAINAKQVYQYFGNSIPMIFDGGECKEKLSSTICEVIEGKIKIRRQGPITKQDIINKLGNNIEFYK